MATDTERQDASAKTTGCSRTNIVLNDALLERARRVTGLRTKREVVEEGLRVLVRISEQEGIRKLRGKLHWEGDLDQLRRGRFEDVDS